MHAHNLWLSCACMFAKACFAVGEHVFCKALFTMECNQVILCRAYHDTNCLSKEMVSHIICKQAVVLGVALPSMNEHVQYMPTQNLKFALACTDILSVGVLSFGCYG